MKHSVNNYLLKQELKISFYNAHTEATPLLRLVGEHTYQLMHHFTDQGS